MIAIYTQNRQAVWNFADISRFHVTGNGTGIQAVAKNGAGGELARYKNREQCTYVLEMLMSAFDADERTFVFPTEKELEHAKQHSQEEVRGMVVLDHIADSGKKAERTAETAQNTSSCAHKNDLVFREAAIEALARMMPRSYTPDGSHPADEEIFRAQEVIADCIEALEILPPAQPDNQTNLCDSCDCSYPDCPSKYDDVIFGNGIGNDNICACNKYKPSAQPEPHWIPCTERMPHNTGDFYLCTAKLSVDDEYEVELLMLDTANDFDKSYFSKCIHNGLVFRESWSGGNEALDVIAWMPLPAPYRGGEMT